MAQADDPIDVLARTIWGEARGEPRGGMEAVASVIVNRARNPRWWGHDVVSVCHAPAQFSCWNLNDPNRDKLLAVDGSDPQFLHALSIADAAIRGTLHDLTEGCDSYADLRFCDPSWAHENDPIVKIGNQTFFKLEL